MNRIVIIGGGIAGLSAAYFANKNIPEGQVTLMEAGSQWGGKITTDRVTFDGVHFIVEGGPDTFLATKPWGVALCKELGLGERLHGTNRLFFLLPLIIATFTAGDIENDIVQHLVEGLVRVAIFLGYLALIARTPDIARVFQYHGADHMTIHALQHNDPLRPEQIRKYPTAHPRCGTEFLVVVIMLSIIAFSLVGRQSSLVMIASRILLIPVIASIGYELLRLGARHRSNPVVKVVMWPGILVQKITTKQPTDDMIEVAIVSMREAIDADGQPIPAGSIELAWEPLENGPVRPVEAAEPGRARPPGELAPSPVAADTPRSEAERQDAP